MLPEIGKPFFKMISIVIEKFYLNLGFVFNFLLGKSKKYNNSSFIKVTTPGFATLILILVLFIMLLIAVI
jgi:hypothetical protein